MDAGQKKMEDVDRSRFKRPGLQIETFPVINLPQTDGVSKEIAGPVLKKHGSFPARLPLVSSKTHFHIRPIRDYLFGRKREKPKTTNGIRNSKTKPTSKEEPKVYEELYKMSFPCFSGCATCAFSQCFGPVRVYVSQYKQPKRLYADEIRDSKGRKVIPRDRIREFRGLMYDKDSNSCFPPIPRGYSSIHLNTGKKRRIIY